MNKQIEFYASNDENFFAPTVVNHGKINGLYFFDMEYIAGTSFLDFATKASKQQIDEFVDNVNRYIQSNSKVLLDKVSNTREMHVNKLNQLRNNSKYKIEIERLQTLISNGVLDELPLSKCHGDLTTHNMIFAGDKQYLIDFLDVYLESYYWDLAKLKQSFIHNWNNEALKKPESHRIEHVLKYIWSGISRFHKKSLEDEVFLFIDLISLLRLEPYLKSNAERNDFDRIIKERLNKLKI